LTQNKKEQHKLLPFAVRTGLEPVKLQRYKLDT